MKEFALRVFRNSSDKLWNDAEKIVLSYGFNSGYPKSLLLKAIKETKNKLKGKKTGTGQIIKLEEDRMTVVKLQWINEKFARKIKQHVKKLSKQIKIGIRIVWTTKPLRKLAISKFWKGKCRTSLKCFGCMVGMENGSCNMRNVVYELKCKKCDANYVGQSARCVSDRMGEHYYDAAYNRGNMGSHLLNSHGGGTSQDFQAKVLWTGSNNLISSAEAVFIKDRKASINIQLK